MTQVHVICTKVCAQVTIIEPVVSVNHFFRDVAIWSKMATDVRNGIYKMERVMVLNRSSNN